jgi:uncharacterized protein (TIGR03083 family)
VRRVPPDLVEELTAGCFRMLVPRSHGGAELDFPSEMRVIEGRARADGSVGWSVMIGSLAPVLLGKLPQSRLPKLEARWCGTPHQLRPLTQLADPLAQTTPSPREARMAQQNIQSKVVTAHGFGMEEMSDALGTAGAGFVELLRDLDPSDTERPVPDLEWTVGETAAHMLTVLRRGHGDRRRADSIPELADLNALAVSEVDERRPAALADMIEEFLARYIEVLATVPPSLVVNLHAGLRTDSVTGISYQLCDLLVHGLDIAKATGRDWTIEPTLAQLDLRALLPALGPWVEPAVIAGSRQDVVMTFPDAGWGLAARVGQHSYSVESTEPEEADVVVDPVETLLAIAGRRAAHDPTITRLASWFRPL